MLEKEENRAVFNEILFLRNKIREMDDNITSFTGEFKKLFKKKYESMKNLNYNFTVQYDIMFSSLFGNGITV